MHRLAPDFIIEQVAAGNWNGRFPGSVLFVDISGFSTVTDSLMQHGQHGAEVLATVMRAIFDPLVRTVYAYGGFIANFAGDAFTAVFSKAEDGRRKAEWDALAAGWQIQAQMAANAERETDYGRFNFSAKVGLASGDVVWGILQAENARRAAYYFRGTAVERAAAAEHHAGQGDFILEAATYDIVQDEADVVGVDDFYRVTAVANSLPPPQPVQLPPVNIDLSAQFFPRDLITQSLTGEFRPILYLFVGLQGTPTVDELAQFMQLVFRLQDQYGGFLNNLDFGDKGCYLYLFWGAPVRHENDVNRILNFALDLHAQANRPLRLGITYRIAHAGFIGSDLHEEYTCYGRGVNLAARFMTSAGWGDIWVDGEVEARAKLFHTAYVGEQPFKGFAQPQTVYTLLGKEQREATSYAPGRLVGRESELQQLDDALQPLRNGRFAGVAALMGEAGIGKSRLLHEFLEMTDLLDFVEVYLCQTDEILRQSLNPFRYWLRDYFNQSPEQDETANKNSFDRILDSLITDTAGDELADSLARGRSFLGALVDLYWPDSLYAQLEPQLRFENTLDMLKTLIKAESWRQPVLIVVEDGHWLDEDSRQFLQRLTRNVADFPFAVLLTSRENLALELLEADVPQTTVNLEPLPETAVSQLVAHTLGHEPPPDLLQFLVQRTDGNPYFIEQLLLYMRENELLGKETAVDAFKAATIPTDVQAVLVARLDQLPAPVKDVVQTAAVLGREFERPILAHMRIELEPERELEESMGMAEQEAVWQALDERRYLFRHALMRDAAYDMQVRTRLRGLHQRAALAYERVYQEDLAASYPQIAFHYDKAEQKAQALAYYEKAADRAKENYQNEDALTYYGRALALVPETNFDKQITLRFGRENILDRTGRRDEQRQDLEQLALLISQERNLVQHAELALRQSTYALVLGNYEPAFKRVKESLKFAAQIDDHEIEARAYHQWGRILWQKGSSRDAMDPLEHALKLARAQKNQILEAQCLYDLGVSFYYQSDNHNARHYVQQAQEMYQKTNDQRGESNSLNFFGSISYALGNYLEAEWHFKEALTLCQNIGWAYGETRILVNMGNNLFEIGNYALSRQYLERALHICQEIAAREHESISLDTLGLIHHYLGEHHKAKAYYEKAIVIDKKINNHRNLGFVLTHLGYVLIALEDFQTAGLVLNEAYSIRSVLKDEGAIIDTKAGLLLTGLKQHRYEKASALVREILSWIDDHGADSLELPVQVHLICFRAAQQIPELSSYANAILKAGYSLLQKRAAQIKDEVMRQQFLQDVPYNRDLLAAWQASQTGYFKDPSGKRTGGAK